MESANGRILWERPFANAAGVVESCGFNPNRTVKASGHIWGRLRGTGDNALRQNSSVRSLSLRKVMIEN
jgi:hypothetical protein